ncbi:hypothetical protein AB0J86_15945 [Micromonospora sp. NPDC049559]|uniref:hypothetical protein n=1 Tax=Micromonospora sp. NPDC049559 TaxID=3155923 RepID=UPI0034204597
MSGASRGAALLAAVLAPLAVLLGAAPAAAADTFVRLDPDTVQAGYRVEIKASCRVNTQAATVESAAFGGVTVYPQAGFLVGSATVPHTTRADTYRVRLSCPDGRSATTRLVVVAGDMPWRGPATGFGGGGGVDPGKLILAGGVGTTALGVALGIVTLRRRRGAPTVRPPSPGGAGR